MILAPRFTFIVEKCWKNMYFHSKMAWPPPPYDVISRNHRNWPSLNLTQKAREGWRNSYWEHQVLMFYPLGNKLRKTLGCGSPPPLRVRPRVKSTCSKNALEKVCTVLISSCGTPYKPRKDFRFYCLTGDKGSPNVHKQDKVHSINWQLNWSNVTQRN